MDSVTQKIVEEIGDGYTDNESLSPRRESRFCSLLFQRAEVESWVLVGEG